MKATKPRGRFPRKKVITIASILVVFVIVLVLSVNRMIEPVLRARLNTLIIQGSDSLYTYTVGSLKAHFLGGRVEVENLQIKIDSNRYAYLKQRNALPSLTMQLNLEKGTISGLRLLPLVFNKKIHIAQIHSREANIKLSRHRQDQQTKVQDAPLWKSIRHEIKSILIDKIRLDGLKFLYKHADTAESVKLQFDRCEAVFENVLIDSASSVDPDRVAFSKNIDIGFNDMKFRSVDSTYKMKAVGIRYSTLRKVLEVDSFKLQPTLKKEDFYRLTNHQQELYYIELSKIRLVNARLDRFVNNDMLDADSAVFENPILKVYTDQSVQYPDFESKIGKYPHQRLLSAPALINIRHATFLNTRLAYTQKNAKSLQEGTVALSGVNLQVTNMTNVPDMIQKNPICMALIKGMVLDKSPFEMALNFYLNAPEGRYEALGSIKNVDAAQLNKVSVPLANVEVNSLKIHDLNFHVIGQDNSATSNVSMTYNDLALTIRKADVATGQVTTNLFVTNLLNKLVLRPNNPDTAGNEKKASQRKVLRISSQSFFGLLWKSIFSGIQAIVMKAG